MENKNYKELSQWVNKYFLSFHGLDEEIDANIKLKEKHTYLVVKRGKEIAQNHLKTEEDYLMAVVSCLLHDLGRFIQFKRFRTFRDKDSFDHSLLALDVIFSNNLLKNFSKEQQVIIEKAVYFHNKLQVEESLSDKEKLICNVVRDADKLDIFRVVTEVYDNPIKHKHVDVGRNLKATSDYTDVVIHNFLNKKSINYDNVVTKSDVKLLQLGWIFDLNFSTSQKFVEDKGYAKKIFDHLPDNSTKKDIESLVFDHRGKINFFHVT